MLSSEEIGFSLPASKTIITFLQMRRGDQIKSIELGMKFLNMGTNEIQSWNNQEWTEKQELIKMKHKEEINKLEDLLKRNQDMIDDLKIIHKKDLLELKNDTKDKISLQYQDSIQQLKSQLEKKDNKISEMADKLNTQYKEAYNEFDNKLNQKEKQWEERLNREKAEKNTLISRASNSTNIGQDGEIVTLQELNCRFPRAEIEDTHKQKGRGDFIFKEDGFTMLIETKNYKNNVTKPEIDKFYRDIDTNHDINCGVLISLKSGICSRDDFQLEIRDNKPILFLHNIAKNFDNLNLAIKFFKLMLNTDTLDLSSKEKMDKIKNSIPIIKRNWNAMQQKIKKFQQEMLGHVNDQECLILDFFKILAIDY